MYPVGQTPRPRPSRAAGRLCHTAAAVLGAFALLPLTGRAQSISLLAPTTTVAVVDGEDFATDAFGRPWSMDRIRDIALDMGFSQPSVNGGIWQAQTLATEAFYAPLFAGYNVPGNETWMWRYDEGTTYGPLNPIDAATYTRLSMRTSLPAAQRSAVGVFWATNNNENPANNGFALVDTLSPVNGFRMYDIDLTGAHVLPELNPAMAPTSISQGYSWRGDVVGTLMWPALSMAVGTVHKIDWMRLYNPRTSPAVDVRWATSGVPAGNGYGVNLYVDADSAGYDGDLLIAGIANDGQYRLLTAALPPGNYFLYLKVVQLTGGVLQEIAVSGYSARLTIQAPPQLVITAPTRESGADFATVELGNPWDFDSSADVEGLVDFAFPSYNAGQLKGISGTFDPSVSLNMKRAGTRIPIDPRRYRYLSFRLRVDHSQTVNQSDRIDKGWVARAICWNQGLTTDASTFNCFPVLEGWHRYTLDMWDPNLLDPLVTWQPQIPWRAHPQIKGLRIDPLETTVPVWTYFDDVRLCAENEPQQGRYTVTWTLADADSPACDVTLYYGYDSDVGFVEEPTPLFRRTQRPPGPDSYTWDTSRLPNGRYSLRFEVNDSNQTRSFLSEVPVVVHDSYPRMRIAGMDPTIYYRPKGLWVTLHADGSGYDKVAWGNPAANPVPADYDGDGVTDRAVFHPPTARWYIQSSRTGTLLNGAYREFGWDAATPVPADYDGDGKADLAVFHAGTWYIAETRTGLTRTEALGPAAALPVPADYDADGRADLAAYYPPTGEWHVRQSGNGQLLNGGTLAWGWSAARPLPADYDGDGRADITVYDPAAGMWYIRQSGSGTGLTVQFGAAGMVPVPGDFNADGRDDMVVFNPADGMWHFRFSGGGSTSGGPWGWYGTKSEPLAGNFHGAP